jgi:hypothetical protein
MKKPIIEAPQEATEPDQPEPELPSFASNQARFVRWRLARVVPGTTTPNQRHPHGSSQEREVSPMPTRFSPRAFKSSIRPLVPGSRKSR